MNPLHVTRGAALLLAATLLTVPAAPHAEGFSTTNLQLLQGYAFHDDLLGYDTQGGTMTTLTLNHFSTWAYGDNFAFMDVYRGKFVANGPAGNTADVYVEWHPRLFLNRVLGTGAAGPVRNWGLAGEVNQSRGFFAYLAGLGLDLQLPGFTVAGLNVYYRYDTVHLGGLDLYDHTWQVSPFWTVPIDLGRVQLLFTGFLDLTANKNKKLDLMTQPELLLDVGALAGATPNRVHAGVEWYLHTFQDPATLRTKTVSAPQVMVQWTAY